MTDKAPDFRGFWQWFADHNEDLLQIMAGEKSGRITEILDEALQAHGIAFVYDITEGTFGGELTFTPEGDPQVARALDRFVAQAPSFETWVIHSRRQRKPLPAALAFVKALHGIDLSGLHFKVRKLDGQFHLLFIHPDLAARGEDERYGIAATFLDHALGEALAMSFIGSLDFREAADGIDMPLVLNQIIREAEIAAADLVRPSVAS